MKPLKYDKDGVPVLSKTDIEERAELFLKYFDESCLLTPQFTPFDKICSRLKEDHGVKFSFNVDLGKSPEGLQYRGKFIVDEKAILIDKSLNVGEPRFNFTLAHEIAHFVLHRKVDKKLLVKRKYKILDTDKHLVLDHSEKNSPKDWLEYQANKFASCLLLPRSTTIQAVISKQKGLGVTRRLGTIFVDKQPVNINNFNSIISELSRIYVTSKTAIKIRLIDLSILNDSRANSRGRVGGPTHIGGPLFNIFDKMIDEY